MIVSMKSRAQNFTYPYYISPMGSFNNHVVKILTISDPLLPSHGQTWTF